MRLDEHIQKLLQTHNCVVVPEFGGFLANYRPARLYPHRHVIYPPGKTIAFNSSLTLNDGLLVSEVSNSANRTYKEAERLVAEAVGEWQQRLADGNPVEITGIGKIQPSQEGKTIFKPVDEETGTFNSFGLNAVEALPLQKEKEAKIINIIQPQEKYEKAAPVKRYPGMLIVAALLGILLLLNASFLYLADENYKQTLAGILPVFENLKEQVFSAPQTAPPAKETTAPATVYVPETVFVPEIEEAKETVAVAEEELPDLPVQEKSSQNNTTAAQPSVIHYIIGGSFKDYDNAEKLVNAVKNSGYKSEIMNTDIGYYRVCYAKYTTEEEALKELETIKTNINKNAWILSE